MRSAIACSLFALAGCAASGSAGPGSSDLPPFLAQAQRPAPDVFVTGQPTRADLEAAKAAGVEAVINMRGLDEDTGLGDEAEVVRQMGMRYEAVPVAGKDDLTLDKARALDRLLAELEGERVLLHCRSGNRVGALVALIAFEAGASVEAAMARGEAAGLTKLADAVRAKLEALLAACEAPAGRACPGA